jgi:hypothetical protein
MAEPTVFEMEIEGVVHPIEDKTARAGVLVPTLNEEGEITALKDSENVSHGLADAEARAQIEKLKIYSTTEQNTGKTWIDGKPIYRQCFRFNLPALGTTIYVATGIAVGVIDTVTCFDTVIKNPEGGAATYWFTPEYVTNGNTVNVYLRDGGANFAVSNAQWPVTSIVSVTLEYTKVAD